MRRTHGAKIMIRAWRLRRLMEVRAAAAKVMMRHDPVMVQEILEVLPLRPGAVVVDGTLGLGGHTKRFIERVSPGGAAIGVDWDAAMLAEARERLGAPQGVRLHLVQSSFEEIDRVLAELGLQADGVLLDLGLNSAQVDDPSRGMSFGGDGPLDMRMDRSSGEPASALLNRAAPGEIERSLLEYGDERWARAIAKAIVARRKHTPLRTTGDLVQCVLDAIPPRARDKRIHPATRTFQAVRIWVNGELALLESALMRASAVLAEGGVLAVLSYHSGEDRIVKQVFRALSSEGAYEELMRKPLVAQMEEVRSNPRARSAKLRALRRVPPQARPQSGGSNV